MAIIAITQLVSNCAEVFFSLKCLTENDQIYRTGCLVYTSNKSAVRDIHGMQLNRPCFHVV